MLNQAFVTTAIYALGKQLGVVEADKEWKRQLQAPSRESLPVVRTVHRFSALCEKNGGGIGVVADVGAAIVGQMRSRCFHRAVNSELPAWISIDDDIEATTETCAALLEALDDVQPRIVLTPYLLRTTATTDPKISVTLPKVRQTRDVGGAHLVTLPTGAGGGFGLVGMNRQAMHRMMLAHSGDQSLFWNDEDDGGEKLALFHDLLEHGIWWGEDTSFFRRVPREISVEVLLTGNVNHAGLTLHLEKL
jgi:hypothetical protein